MARPCKGESVRSCWLWSAVTVVPAREVNTGHSHSRATAVTFTACPLRAGGPLSWSLNIKSLVWFRKKKRWGELHLYSHLRKLSLKEVRWLDQGHRACVRTWELQPSLTTPEVALSKATLRLDGLKPLSTSPQASFSCHLFSSSIFPPKVPLACGIRVTL